MQVSRSSNGQMGHPLQRVWSAVIADVGGKTAVQFLQNRAGGTDSPDFTIRPPESCGRGSCWKKLGRCGRGGCAGHMIDMDNFRE